MNYDEAIRFKQSLGYTEIKRDDGIILNVFVVPENNEDFSAYFSAFIVGNRNDALSIKYSSNGKYRVMGLTVVDGITPAFQLLS